MPRDRLFFMSMIVGGAGPAETAAGAGRDRAVAEAEGPPVPERDRAAEAHAAVDLHVRVAGDRERQDGEEVLVPANGDPVLADPAEAEEAPLAQLGKERRRLLDGVGRRLARGHEPGVER